MDNEWQLIDTAPKDGTIVLLFGSCNWNEYTERNDPVVTVGFWEDDGGFDCCGGWTALTFNPYSDDCEATHWVPLPEPPLWG